MGKREAEQDTFEIFGDAQTHVKLSPETRFNDFQNGKIFILDLKMISMEYDRRRRGKV